MEADFYGVTDAQRLTGVSAPSIRAYTGRYASFFSPTATPAPGQARQLSEHDVKLIAYIAQQTGAGRTHEETLKRLEDGALDQFEWTPPASEKAPETATEGAEDATEALVPLSQLRAAQVLISDSQRREQDAVEALRQAQARIEMLQGELGRSQGVADTLREQNARLTRAWWKKLLGIE
ncbi:MAG: hypothetical protein KDE47_12640 [Caldilineaceae bacterium]|nr:hypothetical protein [Caldilineaceae bacterium]MCB0094065.1 hypothetical protein [Caldilineaceae bacterium]